jgi:hypothetical protein
MIEQTDKTTLTLVADDRDEMTRGSTMTTEREQQEYEAWIADLRANPCPGSDEPSDNDECNWCERDWKACEISGGRYEVWV